MYKVHTRVGLHLALKTKKTGKYSCKSDMNNTALYKSASALLTLLVHFVTITNGNTIVLDIALMFWSTLNKPKIIYYYSIK